MAMKTFATRNDLTAEKRAAAAALINNQLLDLLDLYSQTKFAHWNVKGPHFIALHELFDSLAEELEEGIDTAAERATALGALAFGTVRQTAAASRLSEFPSENFDGLAVVVALADRYAAVAKSTRAAIDTAAALGDADTSDLFTGLSRDLDKSLWFLESHVTK